MHASINIVIDSLLLLLAANGSPVLAKRVLADRWAQPLDAGLKFFDGRDIFGPSKTIRGLLTGTLTTTVVAVLLGYAWLTGVLFGLASLGGDLCSSFLKRRLKIAPSGRALGLDQVPESLLPLWLLRHALGLELYLIVITTGLFVIGELLLSRLMFRLGVRDRPY